MNGMTKEIAHLLYKQSRIVEKGWSSEWISGQVVSKSSPHVARCYTRFVRKEFHLINDKKQTNSMDFIPQAKY
jgi:hypothetical protein